MPPESLICATRFHPSESDRGQFSALDMSVPLRLWNIRLATHRRFVNQRQQQIIDDQKAQIDVLLEQLEQQRLRLDDE